MKEILHIYCRVSTDQQKDKGTSIEEQERFGIELSRSKGMDYEVYNEGSSSGSDTNIGTRPVFSNLMRLVRDGEVKHLFVEVLDRLTRDSEVSSMINREFALNKVTVYTRTAIYDPESLEDSFMMKLLGLFAEYDNQLRTQRLRTGRFIRAKQGFWMLGSLPFGFKLGKNKKLVVNKEQSVWVEKMFKWYDEGISLPQIKSRLDGNVATNRGNVLWTHGSISKLLGNPHHKGYYTYLGVKIPCPPIVDEDLWERVNKVLNDKSSRQIGERKIGKGKGQKLYDYQLTQLLECGHCGNSLIGETKRKSGGEVNPSYVCSSRDKKYKKGTHTPNWERGKYCVNNVAIDSIRTEDVVWETLSEVLKVSTQQKEKFKGMSLSAKKSTETRVQLMKRTQTEIVQTQGILKRLETSIDHQRIEKTINPSKAKTVDDFIAKLVITKEEIAQKIQGLENQYSNYENDSLWVDWVKDYQDKIKDIGSLDRNERNLEVKKYVKGILVNFDPEKRIHSLRLRLKLPLIGDSLEYKDKRKKSKGYQITEGSYEKDINL